MSKDEIKIDITNIERLYNEFLSCSNNFSSNALDTLNQSYMSKCSDNRIKGMYSKILNYYKKIEKNYSNILNWWEEYLNDAKGLENYLKGTGSSIVIKNTTLRSFINRNLREIEKYKNPNSNIFPKVNTDLSFDSRKFESLSDVNNAIGKDASNLQNYIDNINTNLDANFKNVSSRNSNPNVNGYNGNIENLFNIQNNGTNNNKNVNVYNGIIGNNSNFQNNYTNSNLNIFYNNLDSSKINNNEINAKAYNGFFGKNNVNVYKGISIDTSLNLDVNALPQNLPLSSFLTLNSDAQKQYLNSGKIFFNDIKANVTMLSQSDFNKLPGTEQKKFKEQGGVIRQELTQSEYDNLDTKDKLIFLAMGGCVAGRGGDTTIREEQLYTMTESEQFTYLALGGKIRGNVLTDNYTPSIEISEMQDILKQINNIKYYFKDGNIIFNINDEEYNMLDIPEPIITYLTISDESLFDTLCDYRNKLIENTETNSNVYTTVNDIIETSKLYANYVTGDKSYKEYLTDKEFATLYKTFMNEGYYDAINYFSITIPTQRIGKIDLNHKVDEDLCSHFSQNANLDYLNNKKQDDYGELSRIRAEIRTSETSDAQLEIIKNLWQTRDNICEQFETNLNEILQLSQLKESGKYSDDIVISNYIDNKIEILKAENDSLKQQLSQAEQKAKQDIYNCVKTDNIPNFKNAKLLDDKIVIDNKEYNYNEIPPLTYAYLIQKNPNLFSVENFDKINNSDKSTFIANVSNYLHGVEGFTAGYMTQEEVDRYSYLYMNNGETIANEYIASIKTDINSRQGYEEAKNYLSTLSELDNQGKIIKGLTLFGQGEINGFKGFFTNFSKIFNEEGEYSADEWKQMYIMQMLAGQYMAASPEEQAKIDALYDTNSSFFYQIGQSIGNMLPIMLATAATGGIGSTLGISETGVVAASDIVSTGMMFGSSYGATKNEALMNGRSLKDAQKLAIWQATSEAASEKLLGAVPGVGKLNENSIFLNAIEEGFQEGTQEALSNVINKNVGGDYISNTEFVSGVGQSAVMGAVSSVGLTGIGEFIQSPNSYFQFSQNNNQNNTNNNSNTQFQNINDSIEILEEINKNPISSKTNNLSDINVGEIKLEDINETVEVLEESNIDKIDNVNVDDILLEDINEQVESLEEISDINEKLSNDGTIKSDTRFDEIVNNLKNKLHIKNITMFDGTLDFINKNAATILSPLLTITTMVTSYADVPIKCNQDIYNTCKNDGIYHFTSIENIDAILESGHLNRTKSAFYLYDNNKTYFFAGLPSIESLVRNIDSMPNVLSAIKINPTNQQLDNLNFRFLVDNAVSYKGNFEFTPDQVEAVYFCLVNDNGNYYYKPISKESISDYQNNTLSKVKPTDFLKFNSLITLGSIGSIKNTVSGFVENMTESAKSLFSNPLNLKRNSINDDNTISSINDNLSDTNFNEIKLEDINEQVKSLEESDSKFTNTKNNNITNHLSQLKQQILAYTELISGMGFLSLGLANILLLPMGVVLVFDGGMKAASTIEKASGSNYSLFKVIKDGMIVMYPDSLKNLNRSIKMVKEHNAMPTFLVQLANTFTTLPRFNEDGSIKQYKGTTHKITLQLLQKLQKLGFIENLKMTPAKDHSLAITQIMLGNYQEAKKTLKNHEKTPMFDFTFELSKQQFTIDEAFNLLNKMIGTRGKIEIATDKKGESYLKFKDINKQTNENNILLEDISEEKIKITPVEQTTLLEKSMDKLINAFSLNFLNVNTKAVSNTINSVLDKVLPIGIATGILNLPASITSLLTVIGVASPGLVTRFYEKDIKSNNELYNKCKQEGIYHFTNVDSAQKIIDSGYIKPTKEPFLLQWMYDHGKAYMFAGLPNYNALTTNKLGKLDTVIAAVHVNPTEEQIDKFNYRVLDNAVTYKGEFNFTTENSEILYFGLAYENGHFIYKQISKDQVPYYSVQFDKFLKDNNIKMDNIFKRVVDVFKSEYGRYPNVALSFLNDKIANFNKKTNQIESNTPNIEITEIEDFIDTLTPQQENILESITDQEKNELYRQKFERLNELEKIKNSSNYEYNEAIEKEYFKLKNFLAVNTANESVYLDNELAKLLELQKNNPNDLDLLHAIAQLEIAIADIAEDKEELRRDSVVSLHELAKNDAKPPNVSDEIKTKALQHTEEILSKSKQAEKDITHDLQMLEGVNSCLIGEEYKLKSIDSLQRKIIDDAIKLAKKNNQEVNIDYIDKAALEIGDSLRYTLLIEDSEYKTKVKESLDEITNKGYKILNFKNLWYMPHYKGTNVSISDPNGNIFEVQFHTPSSFLTKETLTHDFYEIKRNKTNQEDVRRLANDIQITYQDLVKTPDRYDGYNWMLEEQFDKLKLTPPEITLERLNSIIENAEYRSKFKDFDRNKALFDGDNLSQNMYITELKNLQKLIEEHKIEMPSKFKNKLDEAIKDIEDHAKLSEELKSLDDTMNQLPISKLMEIIENDEIFKKFQNFNENIDYFGYDKIEYYKNLKDLKQEILNGNIVFESDISKALDNLNEILDNFEIELFDKQITYHDIKTYKIPVSELYNIVNDYTTQQKFLDFENNSDEFSKSRSYQDYVNALLNLKKAIDDKDMSVDAKFKENLMHILKNVELSRSQRYYGLIDEASLIKYFKKNYNIDLHKNDSKIVNLKETIINSIPKNLNILEKARYIYNKLGELLEYSDIYPYLDSESQIHFYNQTADINNTDLSNIICKTWAELYYQLLVEAGIDPKNITISGSSDVLKHRWINIKIAPNISIVADATNSSGAYTYDLNKIKNHLKTDGFVIYYGQDAKIIKDKFELPKSNKNKELADASKISDMILRHIDKKIGYIDDKYQDEKLKDITDNFNTYQLEQEILKNDTTNTIDIYGIKDMVKPGYNFLTANGYLKILLGNTYGRNSDYTYDLNLYKNKERTIKIYNNDSNLANGLLTLKITRKSDNKSVLYIYTSHNGLVEITEDILKDIMKRINE